MFEKPLYIIHACLPLRDYHFVCVCAPRRWCAAAAANLRFLSNASKRGAAAAAAAEAESWKPRELPCGGYWCLLAACYRSLFDAAFVTKLSYMGMHVTSNHKNTIHHRQHTHIHTPLTSHSYFLVKKKSAATVLTGNKSCPELVIFFWWVNAPKEMQWICEIESLER